MTRASLLTVLLLSLFAGSSPAGLVLDYNFNGNALDSSGNGNNGIIVGNPSFVTGQSGQAISFNNPDGQTTANQYVSLPNSASILALQNSSFTFAINYMSTDNNTSSPSNGRLFGAGGLFYNYNDLSGPQAYTGVVDTSGHSVNTYSDVRGNPAAVTTDGQWHWAVIVFDRSAGQLRQYVDTTLVATESFTGFGSVSFSDLSIGRATSNPTYGARLTAVDDFQLYNQALSTNDVVALVHGVPEPSSLILLGFGGLISAGFARLRQRRADAGR